jgi:hypothetical protein
MLAPTATACIGLRRAGRGRHVIDQLLAPAPDVVRNFSLNGVRSDTMSYVAGSLGDAGFQLLDRVLVRLARVCSVSRLICCSERGSASAMGHFLQPND